MISATMMRLLIVLQMATVINPFSNVVITTKSHGAPSLLQLDARNNHSKNKSPRKSPPNRRTSIKWVIQGVEKCLAEEGEPQYGGKPRYSYRRRIDASLVDALYLMANTNSQKDCEGSVTFFRNSIALIMQLFFLYYQYGLSINVISETI